MAVVWLVVVVMKYVVTVQLRGAESTSASEFVEETDENDKETTLYASRCRGAYLSI